MCCVNFRGYYIVLMNEYREKRYKRREKGSSQGREKRKNTRRYLFFSPPISSPPNNKTKEKKKEEAALEQDHRAVVVFYPTMRDLAAHLCNTYPEKFRLGTISWGFFPDGWPDIKFEHVMNLTVMPLQGVAEQIQ